MVLFPWTKNMVVSMMYTRLCITPLFLLYLSIEKKKKEKRPAAVDFSMPEENICAVSDVFT